MTATQTTYERLMKQMARKQATQPHPELTGKDELMDDQEAFHRITKNLDEKARENGNALGIRVFLEFVGNYHFNVAQAAATFYEKTGDGLAQKAIQYSAAGKDIADDIQEMCNFTDSEMAGIGFYLKIEHLVKHRVKPNLVPETLAAIAGWCAFQLRDWADIYADINHNENPFSWLGEGEQEENWKQVSHKAELLAASVKAAYDCLFPDEDEFLN
jgi:hypothetical protein